MAYNDDAVKARLSSLNESHESIATVAQWVIFHRRHADRTCVLWLERLRETPINRRLTLIYLANEVVQQSKIRRKEDFIGAFSPVVVEGTATAYKGATSDVQEKIRRTVGVWSDRKIFDKTIQDAVEARISELDKSRSEKKGGLLGKSLFSGGSDASAPPELQPLIPLQNALSKAHAAAEPATATAHADFDKLTDPSKPAPSPPVYAARLSALFKSLSSAESVVAQRIKTRQDLVDGLEKLLATNRTALDKDKAQQTTLKDRRETIERKKAEVEDAIMRGTTATGTLSPVTEAPNGNTTTATASAEPERPKVEELTPPPTESLTPTHSPEFHNGRLAAADGFAAGPQHLDHHPGIAPDPAATSAPLHPAMFPYQPPPQPSSHDPRYGAPAAKKRKLDAEFEGFGGPGEDAMAGLDDDVAELLRAESGGI
ncbi:MAG: hypothetical protein LQ352_004393 [Teloschistes flavicans]|nr:MAG: hypothetical protein LQ352_004393 [Teloschistes flavicans]